MNISDKIEKLGHKYAFEDLFELEEQLKEYHILCQMKAKIERMIMLQETSGYDVLPINDIKQVLEYTIPIGVQNR